MIRNYGKVVCYYACWTLFSANQAFAFTLTRRIRVPDWMDIYLIEFGVAVLFSYVGLLITKPRGVPVRQLYRMHLPPAANFFRILFGAMYMMMLGMFFTGMFLIRFAEG